MIQKMSSELIYLRKYSSQRCSYHQLLKKLIIYSLNKPKTLLSDHYYIGAILYLRLLDLDRVLILLQIAKFRKSIFLILSIQETILDYDKEQELCNKSFPM
jgi:hypothetical protein